jgi:hypothetical protein
MEANAQPELHGNARLLLPRAGHGPLLQRDYWAVIRQCRLAPQTLMQQVAQHFPAFAPEELVRFRRQQTSASPLQCGEILEVAITGGVDCTVTVIHRDPQSLTLATQLGHPEAGRITFGAYRNRRRDVIFHIRSRARSATPLHYAGFLTAGEVMQTSTWTDFVDRVAAYAGKGVWGSIRAGTTPLHDEDEHEATGQPTFFAKGD